jgi:hypothetical protein
MIALAPARRSQMGKKGRELVMEKFDVQKILLEYDRALKDI